MSMNSEVSVGMITKNERRVHQRQNQEHGSQQSFSQNSTEESLSMDLWENDTLSNFVTG